MLWRRNGKLPPHASAALSSAAPRRSMESAILETKLHPACYMRFRSLSVLAGRQHGARGVSGGRSAEHEVSEA